MGSSPNNLRITGREFLEIHRSDVAARRTRFKVPELLPLEKEMADEKCIHLFNVGPWSHISYGGSWGRKFIPACPKDKAWVAMSPPIPAVFGEPWPGEGSQCELKRHDGLFWAQQILGVGIGLNAHNSLIKQGVFIGEVRGPKGAIPQDSEIKQANSALREYYQELVREADGAWAISEAEGRATINERHRQAAVELNKSDVPWLKTYVAEARQKCPVCGTVSDAGVIICPNHTQAPHVFDEEKYIAHMASLERIKKLIKTSPAQ